MAAQDIPERQPNLFRSTETEPLARGREFGTAHAAEIAGNASTYGAMFDELAGERFDMTAAGRAALEATRAFAPHLELEMRGMADGAGMSPEQIGALNARTEILAMLGARTRGECSAVTGLPEDGAPPVAVQTWDWFHRLAGGWLVWEIPQADGTLTKTMTEYGIVGKCGVNNRGLGLLFTILHHAADGDGIGLPVHVAARAALDLGRNISDAAQMLAGAPVSASSSLNLVSLEAGRGAAITLEMHPGGPSYILPDASETIIHTNHFLAPAQQARDLEPGRYPDTLLRHDMLRRYLAGGARTARQVLTAMNTHSGGDGAVCCHFDPASAPADQQETLATVVLDVANGEMAVHAGGPCTMSF